MSAPLRSGGFTVRPSFVPHGPTTGVTLLADDRGLTQLAGIPDVAWQTPWEELHQVELVRVGRTMALFATAGGVRYCWRRADLDDFEAWREVVLAHDGRVRRRTRRTGVLVVAGVVLLASFAGGIAALFTSSGPPAGELKAVEAVNLTSADLPAWFHVTSSSLLTTMFPPAGQVVTSTTSTTQPAANSAWARISRRFARCAGVAASRERVFGAAGQQPDYQVSSPVFTASSFAGIQLASTTQYYATTTMVSRDVAEMSRASFGACFAAANADILLTQLRGALPAVTPGTTWRPATYLGGWARGGVASVDVGAVSGPLHLVVAVAAAGHYEVTLSALVGSWPGARAFLTNALDTLVARVGSSSATAA